MKPTTKDLAHEAGVSLATVDRVLNARPGVHQETVDKVKTAAARIGFVRNLSAANLARQKIYRFMFLLPKSGGEFLKSVTNSIDEAKYSFADSSVIIERSHSIDPDPHVNAALLAKITPQKVDGIAIMAPDSPQLRDAIMRLEERGVYVVRFVSGRPGQKPFSFAGIDNYAAGATASRLLGRFSSGEKGKILVVTENLQSLDSVQRRLGFDYILTQDYQNLQALPSVETYGDPVRTKMVIENSYRNYSDITGVYILSSEARLSLEAIHTISDTKNQIIIAHELTPFTKKMLINKTLDAVISQDPGHLARSAIRLLKASCDGLPPLVSQEKIRIEILLTENLTHDF